MNRFFTFVITLLCSTNVFAQVELVDGIEWEYLAFNALSGEVYENKNQIDGDTIINNVNCKKLKREAFNCNQRYYSEEYVYVEDNKLYYYHFEDSLFQLLYDFNPNVGDTIKIRNWGYFENADSHFYLKVDSIKQVNLNGEILNEIYTEYGSHDGTEIVFYNFYFKYIEGIGSLGNFFYFTDTGWCDGRHVTELFCYHHPDYGSLIFNPEKCSVMVETNEVDEKLSVEVFPNPTTNYYFGKY